VPSVFRSVLWNMAGTVAMRGISLLSVPIIARIVPKDDLGTMRIFLMLFTVLILVPSAGYTRFYIILAREHRGLLGGLILLVTLVACLLGQGVGWLGAGPTAAFYGIPNLALALQIGCPLIALECLNQMLRARFERDLAFGIVNGGLTASAATYAVVAVAVAWFWQPTLSALLIGWAASVVVLSVVYGMAAIRRYGFPGREAFRIQWGPIRSVFGQSSYSTANLVLNTVSAAAPIFVLGKVAGTEVVAAYGYAYVLMHEPIRLLAGSLSRVVLPTLVAREGGEERRAFAMRGARLLALIATPGLVWLAIFAKPLSRLVLGPGWDLVPHIMAWLTLLIWLVAINSPLSAIATIRLKTHVALIWNIVLLIGRLLTLWIGGHWGPIWAIALYCIFGFMMWLVWEHLVCGWYGFTHRAFVANYTRCLPASGLMALVCLPVACLAPGLLGLVVGAVVLMVCYPVFSYLTDRSGFDAGMEIVRRLLRRPKRPDSSKSSLRETPPGCHPGQP